MNRKEIAHVFSIHIYMYMYIYISRYRERLCITDPCTCSHTALAPHAWCKETHHSCCLWVTGRRCGWWPRWQEPLLTVASQACMLSWEVQTANDHSLSLSLAWRPDTCCKLVELDCPKKMVCPTWFYVSSCVCTCVCVHKHLGSRFCMSHTEQLQKWKQSMQCLNGVLVSINMWAHSRFDRLQTSTINGNLFTLQLWVAVNFKVTNAPKRKPSIDVNLQPWRMEGSVCISSVQLLPA